MLKPLDFKFYFILLDHYLPVNRRLPVAGDLTLFRAAVAGLGACHTGARGSLAKDRAGGMHRGNLTPSSARPGTTTLAPARCGGL